MRTRLRNSFLASRCRNERVMSIDGRDHLHRFLPGPEWKKLPASCKAPNRGRRLKPRRRVSVECWQCGKEAKRHRRSARYCSVECRRRAQFERDALRKGRPSPKERVRGAARRNRALLNGIRRYGSVAAYLRAKGEQEQRRRSERGERQSQKALSPREEWMNYHRSGLAFPDRSHVIRYVRVFRP
jgi:hypothetical protein